MKYSIKLLAGGLLAAALPAIAQSTYWVGQGASLNWNDAANWVGGAPSTSSIAWFEDQLYTTGYTNAAGAVNNVVTNNAVAAAANYVANSFGSFSGTTNRFYTTLVSTGASLTLGGLGASFAALSVGDVPSVQWLSAGGWTNYTTITGAGSLVVNDGASLISVGQRNRATLDLSGLNTFTGTAKQLLVGATADNPTATAIAGTLLLGKTNTLTTSANLAAPGIIAGSFNLANSTGLLLLGGTNTINTDGLVVGGRRATSTLLAFAPAYSNTVTAGNLKLRGSAGGSSRVGTISIGDMAAQPTDYLGTPAGSSTAIADFSGGTVDILADSIYVGRSGAGDVAGGGFTYGFGTLTVERGTVNVNNLYIAYKQGTNASSSLNGSSTTLPCPVTIKSNAQVTVNGNVVMAFRNNGTNGSQIPYGALLVNDSATVNIGGNVTTPINGISLLQLGGGTVNMTGNGNLTNTALMGFGSITGGNNIMVYSNLVPGGVLSSGTLTLGGNLTLGTTFPLTFDLGPSATVGSGVNDYINLTGNLALSNNPLSFTFNGPLLGGSTYHLIDYTGSKSGSVTFSNTTRSAIGLDQSTPGHVDLIVTNWTPATLTWVGNTSGSIVGAAASNLWTTADTNWSNGGSPDRFYQMDHVVFDDTAIFTNIYPIGGLSPASITVNGSKSFSITNRSTTGFPPGWIQGNCPITMNGTGILLLGSYSNITAGPIVVNNGILRPFDPTFTTPGNNTVLGATSVPMFLTNIGTFDYNGIGSISSGKEIVIKGSGFNGRGAITNGVSNSGAVMNGYLLTLAGDAMVSADIGGWGIRGPNSSGPPFYAGRLKLNGYTLTKLGAARFQMQEVVATDAGNINFGGGNLSLRNTLLTGAGTMTFSNNTYMQFQFLAGATSYVAKAISTAGNFGILTPDSGSAVSQVLIDSSVSLGGPLSVTNNQTLILGGVISGAQTITKYGSSNLVLNAANTYNGQTTIAAGTLSLGTSGSFANSPLISVNPATTLDVTAKASTFALAAGQKLDMNGTVVGDLTVAGGSTLLGASVINGSLTANPNSEIALATTNVTGTMIVSNNLTLAGGHLTWELAPSFDISDALVVGGNLNLTGNNLFTISSIGGFDPSGTNTLITYTGTLNGGLTNLALNTTARFVVQFVDPATTPGAIKVRLVTPSPSLTWKGGHPSNPINWDIQTTTNWDNGGSPDIFYPSDLVRFDDTANTNVVRLVGTIGPAAVSMENTAVSYFVGGSGALVTSSLTNSSGNLTISNTANNFLTGVGMVLNGGTVTFAQPVNASLTANLNGSGTFNKAANSTLTLTGDSTTYSGPFNINAGTLRAGRSNILGSGSAIVASGATLDINGQFMTAQSSLSVAGTGADGWGAINNKGTGRTNAVGNLTLAGNTSLGALTNAWGISGTLAGGGYTLTKTNVNDVWIQTGSDTDLGTIDILQGRLVFGQNGTTLGRNANTNIVRTGATLALAVTNAMPQTGIAPGGIDAGLKPLDLKSGATLESIGFGVNSTRTNSHSGQITIVTNGNFKVGGNSVLALKGPISGDGDVVLTNGGTLLLTGTNTYTSNTFVYSGTLMLANSNALPVTTTLAVSNLISTFGNASVSFLNDVIFTNTAVMRLSSRNGQVDVGGNGTWNGPIFMYGSNTFTFTGGANLLDLAGPLITTNAGGTVAFHGSNTRVRGALITPAAAVEIGRGDGLGAGFGERFTTVTLDKSNLWTGTTIIDRGRVNLGTNNALPPTVPINVGTLSAGVGDRRIFFNLGGYNQTISSLTETAVGDSRVLMGNSSTNFDSTLTYAGTGTNTWGALIVDDLDSPITPRKTGLNVTSGTLNLLNTNTYTGPTLISGGTLNLNLGSGLTAGWMGQLGNTPVTVSGTGTLGGNGLVAGPVTVNSGGAVSPGTSVGQITVANALTFNSGSKFVCEVNLGTGTNDNVVGISTLTVGGTIIITNVGAQPFANGTIIKLFNAANYVAGPVAIQPNSPGNGLMWDTSGLAVNGTLKVVPVTVLGVANPARLGDGNISFTLTGIVGQGYTIRASTNAALPLASWPVIASGSLPTSPYIFTDVNATNYPMRFYQASTP